MKGTCSSDDYCHMLSYFVQYQSITDKSDERVPFNAYACCQEIGIDFGNRLKTLNRLLDLMPHDHEEDSSFSDWILKLSFWNQYQFLGNMLIL